MALFSINMLTKKLLFKSLLVTLYMIYCPQASCLNTSNSHLLYTHALHMK